MNPEGGGVVEECRKPMSSSIIKHDSNLDDYHRHYSKPYNWLPSLALGKKLHPEPMSPWPCQRFSAGTEHARSV